MILRCSIGLCILFHLILLCQGQRDVHRNGHGSDGIGFGYPESEEEDPGKQNALHKRPVQVPSRCKDGELYYPGDQGDDWVCDCRPGYIYYPLKGLCYAAYKRGPCPQHEYLILPPSSVIPLCQQNPCYHDNWVLFGHQCVELGKPGPCPVPELSNRIGVNETTLEIVCTKGYTREEILLNTRNNFNDGYPNSTEHSTVDASIQFQDSTYYYNTTECFVGGKRWAEAQQLLEKNVEDIFQKPLNQ